MSAHETPCADTGVSESVGSIVNSAVVTGSVLHACSSTTSMDYARGSRVRAPSDASLQVHFSPDLPDDSPH